MYKAFGNYEDRYFELRGVEPIFNQVSIPSEYPNDKDMVLYEAMRWLAAQYYNMFLCMDISAPLSKQQLEALEKSYEDTKRIYELTDEE